MMNRISLFMLVVSILAAAPFAAAQAKVRAYTTAATEPGLLAAIVSRHGMGSNSSTYVWDDGRIETRYPTSPSTSPLRASEHRKVPEYALARVKAAIARIRPGRHRGYCENGMLDGADVEMQFRHGSQMIHLPCYVGRNSNPAVSALSELLRTAREYPWWLERPRLQVRTMNTGLGAFPAEGPSVTFRSFHRHRCTRPRPAQAIFTEQENGQVIVFLDGCLEEGAAPEAIEVTRDARRILVRSAKTGVPVVSDVCRWSVQVDLGRLESPTQVTVDVGVVWTFEVSWKPWVLDGVTDPDAATHAQQAGS